MNRRAVAAAALLALLALAMVAYPPLAQYVPANQILIFAAGLGFLYFGLKTARERYRSEVDLAEVGDPETTPDLPTPGDEFDDRLVEMYGFANYARKHREELRERLSVAALDAIQRRRGCSREEAERVLAAGEWTDDPYAVGFFTGNVDVTGVERVRLALSTEPRFQIRARRAALAIERLTEEMRS